MIQAHNIHRSFGQLHVLKGVDLHVTAGEIVGLLGKSGSGKSTLLHILGTLDRADQGTVVISGQEIGSLKGRALSRFRNEQIGFILQFHHLLPEFSALENVMMPALIRGTSRDTARRQAQDLIDYLGLSERFDHKPAALSGGEQQRIAVARALINKPSVLFADEPTGNLDSINSREMHRLFRQLRDDFGHTFLIATHSKDLADICDRRLQMADGLVVEDQN